MCIFIACLVVVMSDIEERSWEEIQQDVFEDIDVGIATLRMEGHGVLKFIRDASDSQNGLIWALHMIFMDPDDLHILHDAFRNFKENEGYDPTPEDVLQIATDEVAIYTRDRIITDWLGDDGEVEFDNESKKRILGNLYMRSLITYFANESKKDFDILEGRGIDPRRSLRL